MTTCQYNNLCNYLSNHYALVNKCFVEHAFVTNIDNSAISHIYKLQTRSVQTQFVDIRDIKIVCFYLALNDTNEIYIAKPINSMNFNNYI